MYFVVPHTHTQTDTEGRRSVFTEERTLGIHFQHTLDIFTIYSLP